MRYEIHYNYFRDYDPSRGRYVQSDPIGLAGGLLRGRQLMLFVYSAMLVMLVLMVLFYRQMLVCIDLIEQGRIRAPKPNPILFNRASKEFIDFVLIGRYRSSPDAVVLRSFRLLRTIIFAQLLIFTVVFLYVISAG